MAVNVQGLLDWLGSKGGQTVVGAAGSGLSAYGNYKTNKDNQQQNAAQFLSQQAQQDYNQRNALNLNRAQAVAAADPLGADQQFAQRNALLSAILPGLRNPKSTPGDSAVAGAMGSRVGIQAVPEGGFDPMMIDQKFGPNATMASIAQRHKELTNIDPMAPQASLGEMYGPESAPYVDQMKQWAAAAQGADDQARAVYEQKINDLAQRMLQQEQQQGKSGFWHKFAKIAGVIGGVAATALTGGAASPLLVGALGAGAGAASAWGSGGSPLMGAITGGLTGALSRNTGVAGGKPANVIDLRKALP